jgi:hypothetical protein
LLCFLLFFRVKVNVEAIQNDWLFWTAHKIKVHLVVEITCSQPQNDRIKTRSEIFRLPAKDVFLYKSATSWSTQSFQNPFKLCRIRLFSEFMGLRKLIMCKQLKAWIVFFLSSLRISQECCFQNIYLYINFQTVVATL